jgi:hypothetical protein
METFAAMLTSLSIAVPMWRVSYDKSGFTAWLPSYGVLEQHMVLKMINKKGNQAQDYGQGLALEGLKAMKK